MEANEHQQSAEPNIRIEPMLELQAYIDRTLSDLARSVRNGHPMTPSNTQRLFARRWAQATWEPRDAHERAYRIGLELARTQLNAGDARECGPP